MSGPVSSVDAIPAQAEHAAADLPAVEITDSREATVGRVRVRRALPRRGRRTVGAWCFADHMGPEPVSETEGLDIGPHPHIGLHTVTWLLSGAALHRDSLGSEQLIRPGQLNLMTAGAGVVHAEEGTRSYRGELQGVQLWVAQPESTRHGQPDFAHHAELPRGDLGRGEATVLIGSFDGAVSPARQDTPLIGVDLLLSGNALLPLTRSFEHAIVVLEGEVLVGEHLVRPGQLGYLGSQRDELPLHVPDAARLLLLGGEPFGEQVFMWWNFVGRSKQEIGLAREQWESGDERFGRVASSLARIPAPPAL